uniref:BRISC and BRCA1-A complex member 1 n=1 Tax=Opuntia streptacantha TaxID=393608 RepID=A0A7C9EUS7_OPUST
MEGPPGSAAAGPSYTLHPAKYSCEDILFCVDVDNESMVEMKNTGPNGRPITRLDSIKQSILLFINAKLTMNPDHRFAFAALGKTASWVRLCDFGFPPSQFCLCPISCEWTQVMEVLARQTKMN